MMKAEADDSSLCKVGLSCLWKWSVVLMSFDNLLRCAGSTSASSWSGSLCAHCIPVGNIPPIFHHPPTVELASSRLNNLPNNVQQHPCIRFQRIHALSFSRSLEGGSESNPN